MPCAGASRSTWRSAPATTPLLDCRLLADVYVELTGGRQRGLMLADEDGRAPTPSVAYALSGPRSIRLVTPDPAALARHAAFVARMNAPVWLA